VKQINKSGINIFVREEIINSFSPDELVSLISMPPQEAASELSGRASITYADLRGVGKIAIKYYMRGGVFGKFITRRYLKLGKTRGELEYEFLEKVLRLGIKAPTPLVYADKGGLFYYAWLVTRVIPDTISLADLSLRDEDRASRLLLELVRQISILIRAGIWHVDLHPGNVLVDPSDNLHILDFDKAEEFTGRDYELRDRYLFRWRRAAIKHKLPDVLTEIVCLGLRSYHGEQQSDRVT
jgi:tRNA A-37 threonylcarbamoyl transferase component Bud32